MGCVHRCTFCYVRAFEQRAERPADDRYGTSIRVKVNIAEVLRCELAPPLEAAASDRCDRSGHRPVPAGRGTLPPHPRLPRGARRRGGALLDHHPQPADRARRGRAGRGSREADVSVTFSVPTLDEDVWRTTEPGTAPPRQRLRALSVLVAAGVRASVGMAPILPGLSDRPEQLDEVVRAARAAGACGVWANILYLKPGTREHFLGASRRRLAGAAARVRAALRGPELRTPPRTPRRRSTRCGSSRAFTGCATAGRACRDRPRATASSPCSDRQARIGCPWPTRSPR